MTGATAKPTRRRRWPFVLAILAVLLAAGGWWVNRQLEPDRLTALVLDRAGTALGLELSIDGTPGYALRPEPRLVLPNLTVRQPGAATPMLTAEVAEVSLPWDTLLGSDELVITRIGLQRPTLDLGALSAWQASRPPAPFELPTLTDGLVVEDGSVIGRGWRLDALQLTLPELRAGDPLRAEATGRFTQDATWVDFDITTDLATAGLASDYVFAGKGRLRGEDPDVPWELASNGRIDAGGEMVVLDVAALALTSQSPLPNLDASGDIAFGNVTRVSLKGNIKNWPEGWPVLPAPTATSTAPLAYTINYEGAADFSAPVALVVVRDETRLEGRFVFSELTAWIDIAAAMPLPPLVGSLTTPRLQVAGATLEGISIQIEEDAPADAAPEPKP